ncbi:MAG: PAS domain S-box protein [Methanoregulaceae archaeon]
MHPPAITILYVDDEAGLLNLGKNFLSYMGSFIVETAGSVGEAEAILRDKWIDAIVSDYQMPEKDGIEFLQEVRRDYQDLPFILFTGKGREEIAIQALNLGADFYLQKGGDPVAQFTELTHKIRIAVDRYRAKRTLIEYEERFSRIFGASPAPIIIIKISDGTIVDANVSFEQAFGYIPGELPGKNLKDLTIWKDPQDSEAALSILVSEKSVRNRPYELRDLQGNLHEILISGETIRLGDEDCFLIQMHDISETLRMQELLRESEERYRLLFNNTLDAYALSEIICDEKGIPSDYRFLDVNPAFERITGFQRGDVIGRRIREVRPGVESSLIETYGNVALSGKPVRFDNYAADLDRYFEVRAFSPRLGQFAIVFSEITERRHALDELVRKNEELGQLNEELLSTEEELRQNNEELTEKERQLKESESHLEGAQHLAQIGSWESDITTGRMIWTRETFRIFGLDSTRGAPEFQDLLLFWHPDDRPAFFAASKALWKEGVPYDLEQRILLPDGRLRYVRVQGEPVKKNGTILRIWGTIQDITRRKEIAEELTQTEEKFSRIFHASPAPIIISRFSDGTYLEVNEQFTRLMGYNRNEAIGHTSRDLGVFIEYRERDEMVALLEKDRGFRDRVYRLRRKDGEVILAKVNAERILFEGEDCILFIIEDITKEQQAHDDLVRKNEELGQLYEELRATEEELRQNLDELIESRETLKEQDQRYLAVFEHTGTATFIFEPDGIISLANNHCERISGYSRQEIEGRMRWTDFVFQEDLPWMLDLHRKRKDGQGTVPDSYEFRLVPKSGEIRHVLLNIGGIPGTGKCVASVVDITDRKLTEHAYAEGNRKLNLLTSIIRHDILNRMMVLQGNIVLAAKKASDPAVQEYLKKIESSALQVDRMMRLTKEYESLGRQVPGWHQVSRTVAAAAAALDHGNVSLQILTDGLEVFSDPLFERVFANLIENSLMHGQRVSEIRIHHTLSEGTLRIIYEDNGVGISSDMKERIFDRGVGKNTGLGLYLVREILGITDISIREGGEPGKGARFEILVPGGTFRFRESCNTGSSRN